MRVFHLAVLAVGVGVLGQAQARECQLPSGKMFTTPHFCEEIAPSAVEVGRSAPQSFTSYTPPTPAPKAHFFISGRQYILGPKGGCYYINRNGNKSYVDRSLCN